MSFLLQWLQAYAWLSWLCPHGSQITLSIFHQMNHSNALWCHFVLSCQCKHAKEPYALMWALAKTGSNGRLPSWLVSCRISSSRHALKYHSHLLINMRLSKVQEKINQTSLPGTCRSFSMDLLRTWSQRPKLKDDPTAQPSQVLILVILGSPDVEIPTFQGMEASGGAHVAQRSNWPLESRSCSRPWKTGSLALITNVSLTSFHISFN